ncbi:MAG: hypothetical protein KKH94_06935 [Candidatus Omnitrophica bacterium]|nr:hypothetical protein [Candidatus Omnitrophota bacterium]
MRKIGIFTWLKKRILSVLKQAECHALFAVLCFVLFTWPFYVESENVTQGVLFFYILTSWLVTIVLLFLISISFHQPRNNNNKSIDDIDKEEGFHV